MTDLELKLAALDRRVAWLEDNCRIEQDPETARTIFISGVGLMFFLFILLLAHKKYSDWKAKRATQVERRVHDEHVQMDDPTTSMS